MATATGEAGRRRVVVVGGGFGGLAVVHGLARAPVDVVLIDRANHHLFQPLLYQVATAALAPSDIAEPLRGILAGQANAEVVLAEVTGFDLPGKAVLLGERRVPFDTLVVAAGARTSWFGHDAAWSPHAPGLKTLGDALALRRRILGAFEAAEQTDDEAARQRLMTFVVVGGGPTGVEMAGAIREVAVEAMAADFRRIDPRSTRVVLVEAGADVLGPYSERSRDAARRALAGMGVEVRTGAPVETVDEGGVVVGGERIEAAVTVWAAGVRASPLATALADAAGVAPDRAGRVPVDPSLRVPGLDEVYAIGDLAACAGPDGRPLPGVAPVAIQQGQHVARVLARAAQGKPPPGPFAYTDYGSMATIGRSLAVAELYGLRLRGFFAWLLWVFVHLMTLVGHRNRLVVFTKWAWAWLTWERSSRLLWGQEAERG
jgi:NADH dehydrogenase